MDLNETENEATGHGRSWADHHGAEAQPVTALVWVSIDQVFIQVRCPLGLCCCPT